MMTGKTILKLDDVEVIQGERGVISFITQDKTNAMFDLAERVFELEDMLTKKRGLIRCGIAANYSGDSYKNEKLLEVQRLLTKGHS